MPYESPLTGEEDIAYKTTAESGEEVFVTQSKVIVDKRNDNATAVLLDEITMFQKSEPHNMTNGAGLLLRNIFVFSLMFLSGMTALIFSYRFGLFDLRSLFFIVLTVALFSSGVVAYRKLEQKDTSPPPGLTLFSIKTSSGDIGFKMYDKYIEELIQEIEKRRTKKVTVQDNI